MFRNARFCLTVFIALLALTTLLTICPTVASASETVPNLSSPAYSYQNPFYNSGYWGQCTWFSWGRAKEKLGVSLPFRGNAAQWWTDYSSLYVHSSTPAPNSVAVWSGGCCGHVGFVEQVSGSNVVLNEANWNTYSSGGGYDGAPKTLTVAQMQNRGTYSLLGYVYLGSTPTPSPVEIHEYDRIKGSGAGIFFVEKGKKRWIPNTETLLRRNAAYGGDVKVVSDAVLNGFPTGRQVPDVYWPNNSENVLVSGPPDGRVYVMKDGAKRYLVSWNLIDPDDGDFYYPSDVRGLSATELGSMVTHAPIYNDGMLFSWQNGPGFVIERSKRRFIPNPDTLIRRYGGITIHYLPQNEVEQIPSGRMVPDIWWPNNHENVLVSGPPDGRVYVMKDGAKRYLCSFDDKDPDDGDFYYPSDVRGLSQAELESMVTHAPIYNDGQIYSWQNGPAFVIERNKRRGIPNPATFNARKYNWSAVRYLPENEVQQIPAGRIVPDSSWPDTHDGILLQQTGSVDVWLMKNGFRQRLVSMDTIDPDGDWYYPSDIRLVSSLAGIPVGYIDLPLALSMDRVYWASYADYQAEELSVDFIIKNTGANDASAVTITGSSNTGGVTVISALPMIVGDISAGNQKTATLQYNVPSGVSHFRTSLTANAKDTNRNTHLYP